MKRFTALFLLLPLLASCGSAVTEAQSQLAQSQLAQSQFTPRQAQPTLSGQWSAALGTAALRLSLEQEGSQLRGQAELPALAWNEAGTFEVRGEQTGPQVTAQLLRNSGPRSGGLGGNEKAYDLTCERSPVNIWTCTLSTHTASERLSVARAWYLTLIPVTLMPVN